MKNAVSVFSILLVAAASAADSPKNIVHIRADDLRYDKSCLCGHRERYLRSTHGKVAGEFTFLRSLNETVWAQTKCCKIRTAVRHKSHQVRQTCAAKPRLKRQEDHETELAV